LPPGTDGRTFHSFTCRIARERIPMYTARSTGTPPRDPHRYPNRCLQKRRNPSLTHVPNQ
jgi:hypothetical protein